jgi:hypothetical protein
MTQMDWIVAAVWLVGTAFGSICVGVGVSGGLLPPPSKSPPSNADHEARKP